MPSKNTPRRDAYSDACGVEEQRIRHEQSLAMQDARMLAATGSAVDMLPDDVAEEVAADSQRAPRSQRDLLKSPTVRKKLDLALAHRGEDLTNAVDPGAAEDAMIALIDNNAETDQA